MPRPLPPFSWAGWVRHAAGRLHALIPMVASLDVSSADLVAPVLPVLEGRSREGGASNR